MGLRTHNLGVDEAIEAVGVRDIVAFDRALVSSYRPSIVTFPLYLRVSEILPLLCSSTQIFPTPPL